MISRPFHPLAHCLSIHLSVLVLLLEQFPIAGSFGRSHQGPEKESYLSEITQGGTAESGWAPKLLPDPLLSLTGE